MPGAPRWPRGPQIPQSSGRPGVAGTACVTRCAWARDGHQPRNLSSGDPASGPGAFGPPSDRALLLCGVVELAERGPALAVELGELLLLDGGMVGRARVDLDPGQQERELDVLEVLRLPENVLAAQVVAALLEDQRHRLGRRVAEGVALVVERAFRVVLLHERHPVL